MLIPNLDASLVHVLQLRVDHLEHRTRWDVALLLLAILMSMFVLARACQADQCPNLVWKDSQQLHHVHGAADVRWDTLESHAGQMHASPGHRRACMHECVGVCVYVCVAGVTLKSSSTARRSPATRCTQGSTGCSPFCYPSAFSRATLASP